MAKSCSKNDRCCSRTYVEPYRSDGPCKIVPCGDLGFDLEKERAELLKCWAAEQIQAAGTTLDYYSQAVRKAILDPLYNEPEQRVWEGPYRFKAHVTKPEQNFETREEGSRILFDGGVLWIPLLSVEQSGMNDTPKEGDVVRFWQSRFFDEFFALDFEGGSPPPPEAGYYFDVIRVNDDGHIFDTANFAGFRCDIKRRLEFTPERRLTNRT